tara:strand:+ start:613 stop:864 length:252 start_codon:yes stop_codon:yes gene_type:complete
MWIDLTDDETNTTLAALEIYRDLMTDKFHWSGIEADKQEADHAEKCWQKLITKFDNSMTIPTHNESEKSSTSIDPYDLSGLEY